MVNFRKKTILFILCALSTLLLFEISSRAVLTIKMQVPFFRPGEILYVFYPKLKELRNVVSGKNNEYFDILLLGGSTLHPDYGNIEELLATNLESRNGSIVRIFNLASPGFSSLDSYSMYKRLVNRKFDLVVLYDGLNEVRANNCPPDIFKDDYSHYAWYESIKIFDSHKEIDLISLPYHLHQLIVTIKRQSDPSKYVPANEPKPEWAQYGCDIKTELSFKENYIKILEIAKNKKEAVLLMTFASYIPDSYNYQNFLDRLLDYGEHESPVELWGNPDCVTNGLAVHNEVVRELAAIYRNQVIFVDQNQWLPKEGLYFDDICHLTDLGCAVFADNIMDGIEGKFNSIVHEN